MAMAMALLVCLGCVCPSLSLFLSLQSSHVTNVHRKHPRRTTPSQDREQIVYGPRFRREGHGLRDRVTDDSILGALSFPRRRAGDPSGERRGAAQDAGTTAAVLRVRATASRCVSRLAWPGPEKEKRRCGWAAMGKGVRGRRTVWCEGVGIDIG